MARLDDFAPWVIAELTDAYEQAAMAAMAARPKKSTSDREGVRARRRSDGEASHD